MNDNAGATPQKPLLRRAWQRVRRIVRGAALGVAALLVFGVLVSLFSMLRVPSVDVAVHADSSVHINEITQLYPVTMARVVAPRTVEEIAAAVRSATGPVSIGGGRYSMGGQTATPDGLQLDMRGFRGVVSFEPAARTITVVSPCAETFIICANLPLASTVIGRPSTLTVAPLRVRPASTKVGESMTTLSPGASMVSAATPSCMAISPLWVGLPGGVMA